MSFAGKIDASEFCKPLEPEVRAFTIGLQLAGYYYGYYYRCSRWWAAGFSS